MDRRDFLTQSLKAASGLVLVPMVAPGAAAATAKVSIRLHPDRSLRSIAPDFVGLGYEAASVAVPGLLSGANRTYVQLVRNLGAHGVIRIGGNTSDYASFDPNGIARSAPQGTVVNTASLRQLRTFLDATGWDLIWGLNLARGTPQQALAEAGAVIHAMGDKLLALQIGNEPDLFKPRGVTWDYAAYLARYRQYKAAIRQYFPLARFAGPDVASATQWAQAFAKDEGRDLALLTQHYYIGGSAASSSTTERMLADDPALPAMLGKLEAAAAMSGTPYRISEANSFYGGGKAGVSDTFAAALWGLDFMFTLVSENCAGVNLQSGVNHLGFVSHYTPIGDDGRGQYPAMPEYYGMLAFAQAAQGHQIALDSAVGGIDLKAYATARSDAELVLVVINKDAARNAAVTANCGRQIRQATATRLTAPSSRARKGTALGDAMVDKNGHWNPAKPDVLASVRDQVTFEVPAASAALVALAY